MTLSKKTKHIIIESLDKDLKTPLQAVFIKNIKAKRHINMALKREYNDQKRSFAGVLQNSYSEKFCKFHRKAPVLESLFNKLLCFPKKFARFVEKFAKFLRIPFLQNTSADFF